ncbi:aconitate hydratase AcnA [Arcobacter sp. YIC-310]|uniref:aconitate hydratase AcnA n=1 Tax=Arcobacter sp. YIC-310 TaxID=3376632 RepID=UPI003C1F1CB7
MNKFVNSFTFNENVFYYYDLKNIFDSHFELKKLPVSLKLLLEANIRNENEEEVKYIIDAFIKRNNFRKIGFYPTRVVMDDYHGVPILVDLSSLNEDLENYKKEDFISPKIQVDLIVKDSVDDKQEKSIQRNKQRHHFIKWCQNRFDNFTVIPPGFGVYHQVNLEYLSTIVNIKIQDENVFIYPETLAGTDSKSTMMNALGVLSLKFNTLETQAILLKPYSKIHIPKVLGIEVVGSLAQGVSILDTTLNLTNLIQNEDLTASIIEFYGPGLKNISVEDRAYLSEVVIRSGAICGYFCIDDNSIDFIEKTRGVDATLIKTYYQKQGIYNDSIQNWELDYDKKFIFELSKVKPLVVGPKNYEERYIVENVPSKLQSFKIGNFVKDNDIVLANIISCTFTSNPTLLIQAALLAKKACMLDLRINKNINSTLTLGSIIIKNYLEELDLLKYFKQLGFKILDVNYLNSSTKLEEIRQSVVLDIQKFNLNVSSVNSGKDLELVSRDLVKSNWSMSPALVVAYALKGNMNFSITKEPISTDIFLSDLWPSISEVNEELGKISSKMYADVYKNIFIGDDYWQNIKCEDTDIYPWNEESSYIQKSTYYNKVENKNSIADARIVALLFDDVSSELISPEGNIPPYSPAAFYLLDKGLRPDEFNTFSKRRSNTELLQRGAFSDIEVKNKIVLPKEGGYTKDFDSYEVLPIYEYCQRMKKENIDLVIFAGENYGVGKGTDWAAKATNLLGINCIIAKSFDENHRSDLVKMGILPLCFMDDDIDSLKLKGNETITIDCENLTSNSKIDIKIKRFDEVESIEVHVKLLNDLELEYFRNKGVINYLLSEVVTGE